MLSLVEVQCPHCDARGQIMLPPMGAIVFGPCPQCSEPVAIFFGKALPLDGDVMTEGTIEERHEHILAVLSEFLSERLTEMLSRPHGADEGELPENEEEAPNEGLGEDTALLPEDKASSPGPITLDELERFTEVDLELLDDAAYFKSVFDKN